ncbi:MAG: hypothetical protein U0670_02980 [Anaerolineae bacterium]
MAFSQLWGVIRYEALMQWRRRTMIVLCVFFGVGMIGLMSMVDSINQSGMRVESVRFETTDQGEVVIITSRSAETGELQDQTVTGDAVAQVPRAWEGADLTLMETTWSLIMICAPGLIVLLLAIAALLGDVIPIDRQYRVRDLTNSAPLPVGVYITGKLVSVWVGLAIGLCVTGAVIGLFAHFRIGPMDGWLMGRFWLFNIIPAALIAAGYPVLLGGLAYTRRGAVLILLTLGLMPLVLAIAVTLVNQLYADNPILRAFASGDLITYDDAVVHVLSSTLTALVPFAFALIGAGALLWGLERRRSYA